MNFHYDSSNNILRVECGNILGLDDLRHAANTITNSQDHPPNVATLWDCRQLDFTKLDHNFEEQIIALRKMTPQRGNARIAIVVSDVFGFGLSRMYELKSQGLQQKMMVFRDIDKAIDWLRQ